MTIKATDGLLALAQEGDAVSLCCPLVRIKSINPPGNERVMAEYVVNVLREAGLDNDVPAPTDEAKGSV